MPEIAAELRAAVVARAGRRCEYCQFPDDLQVAVFEIDHVVPRSRGGKTGLQNLALTCGRCNAHKWAHVDATDPDTNEMAPLFNPRVDVWGEHFAWSQEHPFELQGKTPSGRATIVQLQMNHPRIVAIRRELAALGVAVVSENYE